MSRDATETPISQEMVTMTIVSRHQKTTHQSTMEIIGSQSKTFLCRSVLEIVKQMLIAQQILNASCAMAWSKSQDEIAFFAPFELQECQGDCDSDGDCAYGLVCFQRDSSPSVPGCTGDAASFGVGEDGFCIARHNVNTLVLDGDVDDGFQVFPLESCIGDCDRDADCLGALRCFQRIANEPVPTCQGEGEATFDYYSSEDF